MFDEKCFFINAQMTKSSQKKGNNYFCNLHTLKSKEKHPCTRAAHASPGPGGRGAPAVRQSGMRAMACVRAPGPWCLGGLRPHSRSALTSPASGGQGGSGDASERHACPFLIDIHLI